MIQFKSPSKHFEEIKKIDENGVEYWLARELMSLIDYSNWQNFEKVIEKAKIACKKSNQTIQYHFIDVNNMVIVGSGAKREVKDYRLSRYACYLITQNGDSSKKIIASAQTYFAIQTRKQEIFQGLKETEQRLFLRGKIKVHNKELNSTAQSAGVKNFGKFHDAGYLGLYGMHKKTLQKKKGIGKDDVLDRAGATELAANLFRITQADDKIRNEKIKGEGHATFAHMVVGQKVRKTIQEIGGTMPEDLPIEGDIKKIKIERKKLLK
ncbi:MAG: DNA-damage-inducible protein, part of SOS response [Candidatus Woesebacteria bacterium GW2011_GWA1_33_30]|uniref:DNA-damage-inducible protein, part of SOS response n=1 Tax=Candidatus Woesebacteria bacterium GW2011_GWA2_33_28 TaxID=1618561 RepID=A0A0F9ZS26_9BACT|nr:MAG: DNA-damage-inducible protein, part of SOS response [Candidatus Woesebacteria bacterium GW2011_GWA2_33_28]KKP47880.1 MAG: DNA-damage-inducible protein, part of SOS response [Candidatus Woesebacteria bacterium GW2011_GWA1_33_30]KKP49323.1 MAG: DNA-damage-inducible protein D [Microgenomates group bacterium GW2011_GWC1_33_32]KKP52033.1 MAG: DNA-damage-inducible protein, part of SOS response [Candidatus Woesebacteria bacterium GW2011_GWB1_33_38]